MHTAVALSLSNPFLNTHKLVYGAKFHPKFNPILKPNSLQLHQPICSYGFPFRKNSFLGSSSQFLNTDICTPSFLCSNSGFRSLKLKASASVPSSINENDPSDL